MAKNYNKLASFSDSQLASNWYIPFRVQIAGATNTHALDTLADLGSPYWGATNLLTRYYGSGSHIGNVSPFVKEDGTDFTITTEATLNTVASSASYPVESGGTRRTVTYKDAAFVDNKIYSVEIEPSSLVGAVNSYLESLYIRFAFTRSHSTGTLGVSVGLVGTDSEGVVRDTRVLDDDLSFTETRGSTANRGASLNVRADNINMRYTYRIVIERTFEPAASETAPDLTLDLPGLQVVILRRGRDRNHPATLSTDNIIGGLNNPTGTVTQWTGDTWKSPSMVVLRPDYLKRVNFTSISGAGNPGIAFDDALYPNNNNVVALPLTTTPFNLSGGDISVFRGTKITLRNTSATTSETVTFTGMLVGVLNNG